MATHNHQTKKPFYSIVVPVYNSALILPELSRRIAETFSKLNADFEVIFVDDGSRDGSYAAIEQIHAKDRRFRGIQLMRNFGQQNAVFCGFKFSKGDFVITMDDDLQHAPEDIPKFIAAMEDKDVDVVIADFTRKKQNIVRRLGSSVMNYLNSITFNKPRHLKLSSYRMIRRIVIDQALCRKPSNPTIGPMLMTITSRISNIKLPHYPRKKGQSGYGLFKIFTLTLDVVANNSVLPLRVASVLGICASTLAIIFASYLVFHRIYNRVLPGWTSLIVINLFFFGLILFSMGIIGEYLIRIMHQVKNYPTFIIRKKTR